MDVKGHPKKPLQRNNLPLATLANTFLAESRDEDPTLTKYLVQLDDAGMAQLGGVLGRFDPKGCGELDAAARLLARRILGRLHRPGLESLVLTNRALDYLDLNNNALLEEKELELCVEIFELFARADSDNDTLSVLELEMLYAVLRHLDTNHNGVLDSHERVRLRQGLDNPRSFLVEQRQHNPLLRSVLDHHAKHTKRTG